MSFALFVIYLLLTFARPSEHFPELRDWPLIEIASILALVGGALAVLMGSRPPLRVQVALIIALVAWMAVTVGISPLRSVESFERVLDFMKGPLTALLLVLLNVTSVRRIRTIAFFLTIPAVFLSVRTISDYNRHAEEVSRSARGDLEAPGADTEWDNPPSDQEPQVRFDPNAEFRVMKSGLFGDPNDLALTLIAILPFTIIQRRSGAYVRNVLFVWLPVAVILYGVYVTRSRGGVVALACVIGMLVRHRLGNSLSVAVSGVMVMALLAAGFVGNRSMSIDQSASGRIEMWSAGLLNLKHSPVWGIGFGHFDSLNEHAAHSAYVQCFAELGMVGYLLWLGVLFVTLDDLRLIHASTNEEAADLRKWARAIQVSLIGFLVGSIFLSRAYDVQLFILIGLGIAIAEIARRRGYLARVSRGVLLWTYIVGGTAVATIIGYWLYMRLLR
jgi:hypothetical protein